MADTASQFDISQLSIKELHKLQFVRRMEYLRGQRDLDRATPIPANPVHAVAATPPGKACPLSPSGSSVYPNGLLQSGGACSVTKPEVSTHNPGNQANTEVNAKCTMADTVVGTINVTDPWSFSPCPPQRHEFPFWQGRPLPMQLDPPARDLRLDATREAAPNFGGVPYRAVPQADVQALELCLWACDKKCQMCPAKCGKLPADHLNDDLHLCSRCDLPLLG